MSSSLCNRLIFLIETYMIVLILSSASSALARPTTRREQRLCELRLLQPEMEATSAAHRLQAYEQSKTIALLGGGAFIAGYAVSVITSLSLGATLLAAEPPANGSSRSGRKSSPVTEPRGYWSAPIIPLAGPFMFASHATSSGYVALGVTLGALQVLGAITFIYSLATRPRSPCELRVSLDPTGFTLRF